MNSNPLTFTTQEIMDFRAFEATPGISVIMLPDAPLYTHIAVSNDFIRTSGMKREDVIGKGHFEVFPKSPDDPNFTGEQNLRASFEYILQYKEPHEISIQRYDIPSGDGTFRQKYWKINNAPILSDTGEVLYIIHSAIDITNQVVAEQTIKSIQGFEKAYQFFMTAPVIVGFVRGKDYIIELANEGLLEVWGRGPEVIGLPLTKAIPELEQQGFTQLLDEVCKTGVPFHAREYPITLNRNGKDEVLYFDFVYKPFYENGTDKNASGVISVGHDVTDKVLAKKRVEEAKAEAEKQKRLYETINGSTPDLIYVFDLAYRFTYANPALLTMWGKSWDEAIGKGLRENGYEEWHAQMHEREIDQVVATKQSIRGEVSFPHATLGKRVYDYIFAPVINENGEVEAIAGTTRDITEIKLAEQTVRESEARTRLAVEAAHLGTYEVNVAQQTIVHSPRAAEIIGHEPTKKLSYQTFTNTLHPEDRAIRQKAHEKAKRTGELFYEARIILPDQSLRWLRLNGLLLQQNDSPVIIGTMMDITDEKRTAELLEQKIEERTRELQQVNIQLKEFTYAASHDLQEPLRKISYFVDRLVLNLGQSLSEENKMITQRIQLTTGRMRNLIDDLLAYSSTSMGVTGFVDVDLNSLIGEVLDDMEATVKEKNAVVQVLDLPVVKGDQRQLRQLFQNLISNALKYHRKGSAPHVQIVSQLVKGEAIEAEIPPSFKEHTFHQVQVKDNGIGFDPDDAERIFRLFQRLHGKAEYEGTGVGLAIVQKVVENHHGLIWADSQPNKGSIFSILLPQ
ncbi:MAG TPA: PAS domain S-box protein [Flavisolibacter sp.]|jgi:hypothetical protein|nr:PAS domain S-box protein [Flavisolibacter sp.]